MIAKLSPLQWNSYILLQSYFQLTDAPKDAPAQIIPAEVFRDYIIDVDFRVNKEENGEWQVFAKVHVNWEEPIKTGYRVLVEGVGRFSIQDEDVLEKDKLQNMAYYSTVNIMINRLRAHITELTASSILGAYTLPAIDITDLFKQKAELVATRKAKKSTRKKSHRTA
jgi:preprotein translocase subunit SecB